MFTRELIYNIYRYITSLLGNRYIYITSFATVTGWRVHPSYASLQYSEWLDVTKGLHHGWSFEQQIEIKIIFCKTQVADDLNKFTHFNKPNIPNQLFPKLLKWEMKTVCLTLIRESTKRAKACLSARSVAISCRSWANSTSTPEGSRRHQPRVKTWDFLWSKKWRSILFEWWKLKWNYNAMIHQESWYLIIMILTYLIA